MALNKENIKEVLKRQIMPEPKRSLVNRLEYIDLLKIIAAFLTVFYHFAYYKTDYGFAENQMYIPNFNRVIMCAASCCVPLFFLINGELMLSKSRDWKKVYIKAIKIALLTVVWSVAGFPSWFFKTLIILYLLYPLFQYCYAKQRKIYYIICIAVFVFPFLYNFVIMLLKWLGYANDFERTGFFTMYSILYFLLGPLLSKTKSSVLKGISLVFLGLGFVVAECFVYTNIENKMFDGVNAAFPTIGALLLSVGIYFVIKALPLSKFKKTLGFFGNSALSIYLMHMLVIDILNKFVLNGIFGEGNRNIVFSLLLSFLICIVCSLLGKLMQRIPIICWLIKM